MSPNVNNFFIFELRIITFFLNVVLIMVPNVNKFFFNYPVFCFYKCIDIDSKCE